jgi:hypothetical protein
MAAPGQAAAERACQSGAARRGLRPRRARRGRPGRCGRHPVAAGAARAPGRSPGAAPPGRRAGRVRGPFEAAVDAGNGVPDRGRGRSYCRSSDATAWFVSGTAQTTGPVVRTDRPAVSPGPAVVGVAEEHGRRARAVRDRSQKEIYVFRSQELLICSLENRHCRAPVERSDRSGSSCAPSDRATAAVVSGFATPTERAPEWIGSKPLRP